MKLVYKGVDVETLHETDARMMGVSNIERVRILAELCEVPYEVLVDEVRARTWEMGFRIEIKLT